MSNNNHGLITGWAHWAQAQDPQGPLEPEQHFDMIDHFLLESGLNDCKQIKPTQTQNNYNVTQNHQRN